jgi:hypothetical protein
MNNRSAVLSVVLAMAVGALVAGCGDSASGSPITPAPDSPTFIYFYTDG